MPNQAFLLRTMRRILLVAAAGFGGMGVAAVWGSFHNPNCGLDAMVGLSLATLITLGVPEEPRPIRRRALREVPPAVAAGVRRFVRHCRLPLRLK